MSDKVEVNLAGVKQSNGVWLMKVSSPAEIKQFKFTHTAPALINANLS